MTLVAHPARVDGAAPLVSVIMANWRGERYIAEAISSVLRQSLSRLEVIVADDASDDGSVAVVQDLMRQDPRVRLLTATRNAGPSEARNRALAAARGDWIAVMDSDDLMHPRRLELLVAAAGRYGSDMVADDLVHFGAEPGLGGRTLLGPMRLRGTLDVPPALFVDSNGNSPDLPPLGYIKPLIRRSVLGDLRYDPRIRVGEDYDLYIRLLLRGVRLVLVPLPLYLYRRHPSSLSHRLSVEALKPLVLAHEDLARAAEGLDPDLRRALDRRGRMLRRALRYEHLVAALKARSFGAGLGMMIRDPWLLRPLARSLAERRARSGAPSALVSATARPIVLRPPSQEQEAMTDGVLTAWPLQVEDLSVAPRLHELACRLTALASEGPLDVTAEGPEGLDALGLVPSWRSAEVCLSEGDLALSSVTLPPGVRLRGMPAST